MSSNTVSFEDISNFVLNRVSQLTKQPRDLLKIDTLLATVGVDSLNAVLLCGQIEDEYELELEPIVMFEYKTAEQVSKALLEMIKAR